MLDPEKAQECAALLARAGAGLTRLSEIAGAVARDLYAAMNLVSDLLDDREEDYSAGLDN
jgi:hypothetical protein